MKYDKMVAIVQEESNKKIKTAKKAITDMLAVREQISVASLVEQTGLSRGFFYKNPEVRNALDEAKHLQEMKGYELRPKLKNKNPSEVPDDLVNTLQQNKELLQKNHALEQENIELRRKVAKLQKQLSNKEISILKNL